MSANTDALVHTKVYTNEHGLTVIEQPNNSIALTSSEQILAVIKELQVCYDYCAGWKDVTSDNSAGHTEAST